MGLEEKMTNIVAGKKAPGFTAKALDGKEYSLAKLLQQGPVVAAFFKISCPVCQFTFPFLERLYRRYGSENVAFLGISQDDASSTKQFAKEFGVTFAMLLDEKQKGYAASNAYGLTNVPTIFLIEKDGSVKVSCMGFEKKGLEDIATELAGHRKMAPSSLFLAGESVPAHKPG